MRWFVPHFASSSCSSSAQNVAVTPFASTLILIIFCFFRTLRIIGTKNSNRIFHHDRTITYYFLLVVCNLQEKKYDFSLEELCNTVYVTTNKMTKEKNKEICIYPTNGLHSQGQKINLSNVSDADYVQTSKFDVGLAEMGHGHYYTHDVYPAYGT